MIVCLHCHNEIPDDSNFCPDCGRKVEEICSIPSGIEHSEDSFSEDGILYYSLNPTCSTENDGFERWIHGNNCGGIIYVGNNGSCICGKCHKSSNIKFWTQTEESDDNIIKVDVSSEEQPLQDILKILPVNRAGLKWLNEITSILITKG